MTDSDKPDRDVDDISPKPEAGPPAAAAQQQQPQRIRSRLTIRKVLANYANFCRVTGPGGIDNQFRS